MTSTLDIVIAGGGRVGFQTAVLLDDRGHDITIVESDSERCDDISDAYVATVIDGDASDPAILEQAGVDGCDAVAALTGMPGLNLAVCLVARDLSPGVRTVARIADDGQTRYERFVDETVYPERAGARTAANGIEGDDVHVFDDVVGDLDIMAVRVEEGAPAAERPLREIQFPTGALVISDDDGDRVAIPDTTLTPGRRYVVAVESDVVDEVLNLLRG